ncbi:MAG: tRNA-intron lyase [Candidatus Baldrarchaeia archaeon]
MHEEVKEKPLQARILKGVIIIEGDNAKELHEQGYYGELVDDNKVLLSPLEALYLLERGKIEVIDEQGNKISFYKLLHYFTEKFPSLMSNYIVYRDLRSRGYIVRAGIEGIAEFRLYERGSKGKDKVAKYLVKTMCEGLSLSLFELDKLSSVTRNLGKELILAIVDRQGDTTYYKVSRVEL